MKQSCFIVSGEQVNLPLYIYSIGTCRLEKEEKKTIDKQIGMNQIFFCVHGSATIMLNNKKIPVEQNQGLIIPQNACSYFICCESDCTAYWISPAGYALNNILSNLQINNLSIFDIKSFHNIENSFNKMLFLLKGKNKYCTLDSSALLYQFLIELYKNLHIKQMPTCNSKVYHIQLVTEYIDKNFSKDITLDELSTVAGLSPQYLCRLFKDSLNMRPFEYLTIKRIEESKFLLTNTSLTVSQISAKIGFKDCSYFCCVFKRIEQISPIEYRTSHMY